MMHHCHSCVFTLAVTSLKVSFNDSYIFESEATNTYTNSEVFNLKSMLSSVLLLTTATQIAVGTPFAFGQGEAIAIARLRCRGTTFAQPVPWLQVAPRKSFKVLFRRSCQIYPHLRSFFSRDSTYHYLLQCKNLK